MYSKFCTCAKEDDLYRPLRRSNKASFGFQIYLKTIRGKTLVIDVEGNDRILALKQKMAKFQTKQKQNKKQMTLSFYLFLSLRNWP